MSSQYLIQTMALFPENSSFTKQGHKEHAVLVSLNTHCIFFHRPWHLPFCHCLWFSLYLFLNAALEFYTHSKV